MVKAGNKLKHNLTCFATWAAKLILDPKTEIMFKPENNNN